MNINLTPRFLEQCMSTYTHLQLIVSRSSGSHYKGFASFIWKESFRHTASCLYIKITMQLKIGAES